MVKLQPSKLAMRVRFPLPAFSFFASFACLLLLLLAGNLQAQSAGTSPDSADSSSIVPALPSNSGPGSLLVTPGALTGTAQPQETGTTTATAGSQIPQEAAAPIKLPSGYGGAIPSIITPGEGRFAQPPIRFTLSLSQGYDDNVFSTPDHLVPPQVTVISGTNVVERYAGFWYLPDGQMRPTPVMYSDTTYSLKTITLPVQQKVGSAISRASLGFQTQSAASRTVYTLDMGFTATDYWNRPGDQLEYNGSASFLFYHRVTPRATLTAAGSASTGSQPNFGNLYGPTGQTTGQYVMANFKMDLAYQLTPRISTDLSYNLDTTLYQNSIEQQGDLYNNTFGAELHYLISPRAVAALSYRASAITYTQSASSDSTEHFLLIGGDFDLTPRIHFNFRTGAQSKVYSNVGSTGLSSPYFESGLSYLYGHGSSLSWTTRYGFEESPSRNSTQKTVSIRTGLGVNQTLTARISANAGANFNRVTTSSTLAQNATDLIQDQLSLSLGLNYVVNPHLSFNLNYSFTEMLTNQQNADYTRNQTFLGATYAF